MLRPYPFLIGWRYFRSDKPNKLLSFISFMAVIGLILGVALLILVMSIMNGFENEMKGKILGSIPHIQISKKNGVDDLPELIKLIEKDENVISTTPFSEIYGMLSSGSVAAPVQLLGVDIFGSDDIAQNFISLSQMQTIKDKEEKFFLAKGVADKLSVQAGDEVVLIVPKTTPSDYGQSVPKIISINIGGVFSTQTSLDQKLILGPLSKVTTIVGLTNPQGVRIKLVDIFNSRDTGFRLLRNLPDSYYFSDWIQTHGNLYQAIKMSKKMVILLVFFIIAVAVFNVVSMLMMTVKDKRFDIAVLKTQGARNSDIAIIFLTQGFLIGSTGSLIGAFLGIMCALNAPLVINKIESIFEFNLLDSNVYPIDYLPSDLYMNDVVMIVLVAISLNLLVTIYPSCKAAKLNVSNELKHY